MSEQYETMYDGGEEEEEDQDLGDEQNLEDSEAGTGDNDEQEYLELFGNKYSLDDDGKNKLLEDAKGMERAYHDQIRQYNELRDSVGSDDSGEEGEEEESALPFDTSKMSPEDQEAVSILQQLISVESEKQATKLMQPFLEKFVDQETETEFQEIENLYGKFDRDGLIKFASDNGLEENLMAAYKAMTYEDRIEAGRRLEAEDRERKKRAYLPSGGTKGGSKIPKYDPEKHRSMSFGDLLRKFS